MLSQIRALPNPSFHMSPSAQARQSHPLTLHLSPTSTANIIISSLEPPLPSSSPFAKLAPGAEVIVAPKSRPRLTKSNRTESRSVTSVSRRSAGGRSGMSTGQSHGHGNESSYRQPLFLRGLDRDTCSNLFDVHDESTTNVALKVWLDRDILATKQLNSSEFATISIVQPTTLHIPLDPSQQQRIRDQENGEAGKHASKIVAKTALWKEAIDSCHIVLSSMLCTALGVDGMVGGVVRVEAAPTQSLKPSVTSLKIFPFTRLAAHKIESIKFGGETKANREAAAERIRAIYGGNETSRHLFQGPLTDGMLLAKTKNTISEEPSWNGGVLRFDPPIGTSEPEKQIRWLAGLGTNINIQVQQEISHPYEMRKSTANEADPLPLETLSLVGIGELFSRLVSNLSHHSSVLLNGGLGSGKTSIAQLLAHTLRQNEFYHTTYFSCRKLVTDETRLPTIKETFSRLFMTAAWGCRFGGSAVIILDDIDRLCPAETELQVGGENGRSRQVSELVCSMARQYCSADSGIALLLTAQSKDTVNSIIIGAHVVREIVDIKAPDKQFRRQVLESTTNSLLTVNSKENGIDENRSPPKPSDANSWMGGSQSDSRPNSSGGLMGFTLSRSLDLLDVAGQTDGFMPGDLELLVSRARSEALVRCFQDTTNARSSNIELGNDDFKEALKGFTPASLRNVTLQTSSTTFSSIGGLQDTRKILLETLQYPTTYAPIFAQCPLRLRSGLLLYGYPGCGKTLLASAVAGECGLNFISVKGPEILNKYIGASEKSVRDLFERAEAARPCVLFFDEFDSIAPKRGHDSTGVTDRVVNQLLTQMDGAEGLSGVYVLAATSRPDLIDPALLRPGRLDKSLICDMPNLEDRFDILHALSKSLKMSSAILHGSQPQKNLMEIAHRTEGYSGADLQAIVYNAHLEAIHDVLGDQKIDSGKSGSQSELATSTSRTREIIQFRLSEAVDHQEKLSRLSSGTNRFKQAAEHAALLAKLDALKTSQREERQSRYGQLNKQQTETGIPFTDHRDRDTEVIIEWKHIETSLKTTRQSISTDERRKLQRIYREFVVGRNGEMPSGEGSVEIGGRTSLM